MKLLAVALFISASVLGVFGVWGAFIPSGKKRFDEMAGILPLAALAAAGLAALAGGILLIISNRHR